MFIKKTLPLSIITAATLLSANVYAEEEHDPSDVASATTSFTVGATNKGDVKGFLTYSFGVNENQQGMVALEGNMNKSGEYNDSRLQYFHVFNLDDQVVPKVAVSLDVIDNPTMTVGALGTVVAVTPVERFSMYLRAEVLGGEYSDEFIQEFGVTDKSALGGIAAGYFTLKTGSDGSYVMLAPEYTYVDGDIESSTLKTSLRFGTPMNNAKTHWGEFRLENTSGSIESASLNKDVDDTVAWFLYKSFF